MQQTKRHARQFGDNVNPSKPKQQKRATMTNVSIGNDENHCPNVTFEKCSVRAMVEILDARIVKGRVDADKFNAVNRQVDDTKKETRRKIMLQERRMEKMFQKNKDPMSSVSDSGDGVERRLCDDFTKEAISIDTNHRHVMRGEKEMKSNDMTTHESTTSMNQDTTTGSPSFIIQTLLLGLILYEVQLHCSDTALLLNAMMHHVRYCFEVLLRLIDSSHVISWNLLMFRLLVELRQQVFRVDGFYSWDEMLHLVFVGAFAMRGMYLAFVWARNCSGQRLQCKLHFVALMMCWLVTVPLYNKCNTESSRYCTFTSTKTMVSPRYSWVDITVMQLYKSMSAVLKSKVKGRLIKEARRAFINPFRFHGRLKKLFTIVRWAKFLAPLIGTCNKLRGHILDMMKKKGQHLTSKTAHKMWSDLVEALTSQSKQEKAVLHLQKCFRERRERKAKRRMELIASQRPNAQHIRKHLREERNISKSKLIKMEKLDSERQLRRQVSEQEKDDIVRYRQSRKQDKKRLLLSPKTAFAVGWKYVAISCVILEVSQMIFAPFLSGELKKMPLDKFLSVVLFASCDYKKASSMCATPPWKHHWLMAVHVFSRFMVPFVHAVCFFDVFVTFFTGELTSYGKLVPKPFFARYILPGIGLQLIVNPTMLAFSKLVKRAIIHSFHVGPSLCFHLMLVCLPLVHWLYDVLLDVVINFVDRQNKILSNRSLNIF